MRSTCRTSHLGGGHSLVDKIALLLASESSKLPDRASPSILTWLPDARAAGLIAALLFWTVAWTGSAAAQTRVDLELVIAVDVSLSMDMDEQQLQRDGYVAAFRDPDLHRAIASSGPHGRIAVVYMEWAGPTAQKVVIPWTLIDSPAAARAFADKLAAQAITRERLTSISAALLFAQGLLRSSGFSAERRVIDVSGDGPNNSGPAVLETRDALIAENIVINGLPIMLKSPTPSFFDLSDLDQYYAGCVIGGVGAFMVPVMDIAELKAAIRRKLLMEISLGAPPLRALPTQADGQKPFDCLVGERQWRWYLDGAPN
jgi:hypothetical protein